MKHRRIRILRAQFQKFISCCCSLFQIQCSLFTSLLDRAFQHPPPSPTTTKWLTLFSIGDRQPVHGFGKNWYRRYSSSLGETSVTKKHRATFLGIWPSRPNNLFSPLSYDRIENISQAASNTTTLAATTIIIPKTLSQLGRMMRSSSVYPRRPSGRETRPERRRRRRRGGESRISGRD